MKIKCLLYSHDWEYFSGTWRRQGWATDLVDHAHQRCRRCGKVVVTREGYEQEKEW